MKRNVCNWLQVLAICILVFAVVCCAAWASRWTIQLTLTTVRPAAVLTTSFVASDAYLLDNSNQLQLDCFFTVGSSAGCQLKIEFSNDKSTWVQESYTTIATGVVTHTPFVRKVLTTSNVKMSVPVLATWFRVSAKALTSGTGTSLRLVTAQGTV